MCGADWNEEAQKMANKYLETHNMDIHELIDQLVYEGFTYQQADYGGGVLRKK